jgi:regulator of PEP synthase PpsR (kinase-PPPase family)
MAKRYGYVQNDNNFKRAVNESIKSEERRKQIAANEEYARLVQLKEELNKLDENIRKTRSQIVNVARRSTPLVSVNEIRRATALRKAKGLNPKFMVINE